VHDKQGIADGSAVFAPAFHNLFLVTQAQTTRLIKPNITAKIPVIKKAFIICNKNKSPTSYLQNRIKKQNILFIQQYYIILCIILLCH